MLEAQELVAAIGEIEFCINALLDFPVVSDAIDPWPPPRQFLDIAGNCVPFGWVNIKDCFALNYLSLIELTAGNPLYFLSGRDPKPLAPITILI